MKIGKLKFKDYAAKKPVTVAPDGTFLTVKDVAAAPSLGLGSVFALSEDARLTLALKRYAMEPNFRLGVIGAGILTKADVIHHLKVQDAFGKVALDVSAFFTGEYAVGTHMYQARANELAHPRQAMWHQGVNRDRHQRIIRFGLVLG